MKYGRLRCRMHVCLWAAVILILLGLAFPAAGHAQIGFSAYMGGAQPTGEFGRTDLNRTPPKSGAESGHAFGAEFAWGYRFRQGEWATKQFNPAFIITLGYSETEFGNNVPISVFSDQPAQLATPESRIRMRSFRVGVRVIPWTANAVTPTVGGGYQRGKMKVDNWSFFGPSAEASELSGHAPIRARLESENISGVFLQVGVATQAKKTAIFFGDAVYHILFSEGVSTTAEYTYPDERITDKGTIKSDFHWWEFRGGLIFFIGD